ncbi:MAG TPA: hypothetical protein VGX68_03620 [Thermoanaerobaculia bacterium]|jgi:hypothetical protein|nr:hypothetical protein [Thermoanaerobaculia bacterium]
MKIKRALPPIAFAVASLAAGCGGKATPVARVEVNPHQVRLPFSQAQTLHLTWTPTAALDDDQPTVFIHLLDDRRKVARTFDHAFPQHWREGTPVSYDVKLYQSAMAPPLPAGKYELTLGLYGKDRKRWALDGLGEPVGRDEYKVAEVEAPAQRPNPRFAFSNAWQPAEAGGDRQVLARRWMAERAVIRLVNQRGPGTVWMVVQVPETKSSDYKVVLDPGATEPSVMAVGSCGHGEANLTGSGLHDAELAMEAPPPGGFCRVLLTSNFVLEPSIAGRKRSVSLENIAWVPAGGGRKAGGGRRARHQGQKPAAPAAPQ